MKKISEKILVLLIILNLIGYQVSLPFFISTAHGAGETDFTEASNDNSDEIIQDSDDGDEEIDEDSNKKTGDGDKEKAESGAEDEKSLDENEIKEEEDFQLGVTPDIPDTEEKETPPVQAVATESADICCDESDEENQESADNEIKITDEIEGLDCSVDCDSIAVSVAVDNISTVEVVSAAGENSILEDAPLDANDEAAMITDSDSQSSEEGNKDEDEAEEKVEGDDGMANDDTENSEEVAAGGQAIIATGEAEAEAVVINHINTNVFTENGIEYVENITGDYTGDINLIEIFEDVLGAAEKLNEANQGALEDAIVSNVNVAEKVSNTVIADADTGENIIENEDGSAEITTGSAEAIAGVINFVNTNIVGNNWLLAEINILGNWTGDLIVPGEGLFDLPSANMVFVNVTNTNLAKGISNFLSSTADTGNNSIDSVSGEAIISTGAAVATSGATNLINTNIVRNNWFFLIINNAGNWVGQVFNWNNGNQELAYEYDFGSLDAGDDIMSRLVSVYNFNSAEEVENVVSASSNTGGNHISMASNASISTGNAMSRAAAFNFINTNIVGNNWFFGIVNNAGNWKGNLVFGYPDLSVELAADKDSLRPGETLNYTLSYRNGGQAKCANTDLMLSLPEYFIYQSDSAGGSTKSGNDYYWSMAGLKPGEERQFNIKVILDPSIDNNIVSLESVAGVKTDTKEVEFSNNYESEKTDIIFLAGSMITIQDDNEYELPEKQAKMTLDRQEDASVEAGSISGHMIVVKNAGKESLYNLEVKEKIVSPAGEKIGEYEWLIAELKKGQRASIEYQIVIDSSLTSGNYRHSASAQAVDSYGREIKSNDASQAVAIFHFTPRHSYSDVSETELSYLGESEKLSEISSNLIPEVLGASIEKEYRWQWLLVLLVIPMAFYRHREIRYGWGTVQRFSRQIGNMF